MTVLGKRRKVIHFHVTRDDTAVWIESKHPRRGKGEGGGQFTSAGQGGSEGAAFGPPAGGAHIHIHPSPHVPMGRQAAAPPQPGQHGQGGGRWAWQQRTPVHNERFSGHQWWHQHFNPHATQQSIYAKLTPERRTEMETIEEKANARPWTIKKYRDEKGHYTPARKELHDDILFKGTEGVDEDDYSKRKFYPALFSKEAIAKATPPPGTKPTFVMLGGRGGSGKTGLKHRVYDPDHTLLLDSDKIKHMLPEFEGWNAGEVHEESSDVLDAALAFARENHLNVVLDATLKSFDGADQKLKSFEDAGYCTEGHYMFLPAEKASERSVGRYFSPSEKAGADPKARGRFVAPNIILGNTKNEDNFDKLRSRWKAWSFWSNDVPFGQEPTLLARDGAPCD